ncbi:DinB family protein [Paenibacillus provencensis]|uniref:DinB family protein n=1 Tax=Paenibacillus provencensis TaxID=441151 RepID=A0ABW3PMY5_9BACL|nr:DinB family protein [Paenibacillus sp. MER 78]MCM3126952.1 DinB family protein [Paenibacillus sp. MER 78]
MIYDLKSNPDMSPIVGMLYSAVEQNCVRLQMITQGMLQNELDYKGPGDRYNSAAQLIKHLMYVDLNWVYRFKGQALPSNYADKYGPMIVEDGRLPMIAGVSIDTFMSNYTEVLSMLRDTCRQLSDRDLDQVVRFGHMNEKEATIRWGIWHMADHNRYHQAHINQLRKWYREQVVIE